MSKEAQSHELTYDLIKRAVHGDQEAIEAYLRYYDAYINSLVMYDEVGPDSQIHSYIDEDRVRIEQSLFEAAAGLSGCRLAGIITPEGLDVKGGEAVHFTLDFRPRRCYSGMRSAK